MRQPTPRERLYAWYDAALVNRRDTPMTEDDPQPGWYAVRMVPGGPFVPVVIWMHQSIDVETGELNEPEVIRCEVAGDPTPASSVWLRCRPISRAHFSDLTDARDASLRLQATHVAYDLTAQPTLPTRRL